MSAQIATQAFGNPSYGPLGLDRMRGGASPADALSALLAEDGLAHMRQVAMLDASGAVAVHTGAKTIPEAGHRTGDGYSVQANMMLRDTVPDAMAEAFESSTGELADRLLVALDAAEAEGGDIRGQQSAAMLIVRGERAEHYAAGRVLELRIEDHREPLHELRRLLQVKRDHEALVGDTAEVQFWKAIRLAMAGNVDEARPLLRGLDQRWVELVRRMPATALISEETAQLLTAE